MGDGSGSTTQNYQHALLWQENANSAVDLNPLGAISSIAWGTNGQQQIGQIIGPVTGYDHAVMWSGTANSFVDLNPDGFIISTGRGISKDQQVGFAYEQVPNNAPPIIHAILWSGTAASAIDLNPATFAYSDADGVCGGQQVGSGSPGTDPYGPRHALLWTGSAQSFVDLHPIGINFRSSGATATNGVQQVGYVNVNSANGQNNHAALWSGTASSYIDLHQYLPSGFIASDAYGIDANGDIVGAAWDSHNVTHPILWQVPEPATLSLLALGGLAMIRRRRR